MMSVMLSAAGSLRWFRDARRARASSSATWWRPPAAVPAGSDGLLFLPYLSGERSPHPDPLARGAFVGLTLAHDRRHLTRAVLEGVAFGLRDGLDLMVEAGMPAPTEIRASGGGTASPLWRQVLADILDAEIATVSTTEGAAYGAALLAAVGGGWFTERRGDRRGAGQGDARGLARARTSRATGRSTRSTATCTRPWPRRSTPALDRAGRGDRAPLRAATPERRRQWMIVSMSVSVDLVGELAHDDHPEHLVLGDLVLVDGPDELARGHDADPIRQVEHVVDVVADQEDRRCPPP